VRKFRQAAVKPVAFCVAIVLTLASAVVVASGASAAGPTPVSQTFNYTGSTATFTVPAGITQLTLTVQGAEGGRGGNDSSGRPPTGGYQGVVTGTIAVTPGQVLTMAVGSGGDDGASGAGSSNPPNWNDGAAAGGRNPLGYNGGNGGVAGPQGSSGYGAAGGAATVVQIGANTIVAGGSGGSGGSGQYSPTLGRLPYSTFSGRTDTVSTVGQTGITVAAVCNGAAAPGCDGGGSGGGGGGALGGAQGGVQFGSGTSNEWYGYGGYPGQNSTAGITGLSGAYQYYSNNNAAGFVTISYVTGSPDAPTNVAGVAQDGAVALNWTAPANIGGSDITDYVVQYALASSPTVWTTFNDGTGAATGAVVTGLTDGTAYVFQVAATNSFGTSAYSAASASVSPSGPPSAPSISGITPRDGALQVAFPATASGSPILNYEYELNNSGHWVSAGVSTSPLQINGLTNGTQYSVQIRAVSAIGVGPESAAVTGTPQAPPGSPTITAVTTGVGTASVAFIPGYLGGGPASGYEYQLNGGAWVPAGTMTSPVSISGLANGTTYAIALRAVSSSGAGVPSAASTVTTPSVPGTPTVSSIQTGDGSLAINFTPGVSGGTTVTGYQYQLTTNGPWTDAPSMSSPILVDGLTNGTHYNVSVRAVNAVGPGFGSVAQSATPATVPSAPTIVGNTVAGSNAQLSADFTAPTDNGGSAITGYQYSTDGGATWRVRDAGSTASPLVISTLSSDGTTPLTNGTTYNVEIRAVNAKGAGQASAVALGMASTTPSAPSISSVTSGDASLQVTFTPASNGGAAITGYEYSLNGGGWTDTGTLSNTFVIPGLTNGTPYGVRVRGVNGNGAGDPSASVSGTPATTPGQPTITSVTRGNRTLTVGVADASDGGSPITTWQYSTDGGSTWATATANAGQLAITTISSNGTTLIANGSTYPIAVRALNAAGASIASLVTTVGPSTVPSAPAVSLTSSDQSITAAFTLPSDGGSPITAVEYRLNGGAWFDAGTLSSPFTILGLTNGTPYSVEVRADNAMGVGAASTPASATPASVPGMPTAVAAVSNTSSADVSWTAPADNGGAPITQYVASAYSSLSATTPIATCISSTTSCSITGLTNGTAYYVSVVAKNSTGTGTASGPRVAVTPVARPSAPTLNSLVAGNALLTLNFTAGSAGGSPITGYQYQLNSGAWVNAGSTSSPLTLSGLTNGTAYTVALRAVSAAGVGLASTTLTSTPYTFPDAPAPVSITANGTNASAVITWAAPFNGGSAITSYTATAFNAASAGSQVNTCSTTTALTCTITGLTNGTTYYISLQAGNAAGLSVRSDPRVAVTPSLTPGAVSAVTGTAGNGKVDLSWTAGSTGGAPISDYTVWYSSGGAYTQFADGTSTATTASVTGLTNGTAYTFKVYAVNSNGTGPASSPSSAVAPLAPGVVPTASTPVSTQAGFHFDITNYDAGTTYGLLATNGTVTRSGSTVTVSGLGSGGTSMVTITATAPGATVTSLGVSGSALIAGVAPTFSVATRTVDGFSFTISNYVPTALYAIAATNGAAVNVIGSHVIVTGLAAGQSSDITVGITRTGYTDASAIKTSTALNAGVVPTLTNVIPTGTGFTFDIGNYLSSLVYTFDATNPDAVVTQFGNHVVVSGLAGGDSSDVTVTANDLNVSVASNTVSGTALLAGTVPTLSAVTSVVGGYTITITNYSASNTYSVVASDGTATVNGADVTVLGLAPGASSTVTVTATRAGYSSTSAHTSGAALATGTAPTFTNVAQTATGFTFDIDNYLAGLLYTFEATGTATVTQNGAHVVVSGLGAGDPSDVTVTATDPNVSIASATVSSSALLAGSNPTLSSVTRGVGGFTFTITNYSANNTYAVVATDGTATVDGDTVTVTDLAPGASSTVTVTATRSGYTDGSDSATGSALATGTAPTFTNVTPTADGFTFDIGNYGSGLTYTFDPTGTATVAQDGAHVTVTTVGGGDTASVAVTATDPGVSIAAATVHATALIGGLQPALSATTSVDGGYTLTISNYSADNSYSVVSTDGTATVAGDTVTVTDLAPGGSSTVTVTAARTGYVTFAASATGSALITGTVPTFTAPTSTADGFTFDIANFDPTAVYAISVPAGAVVTQDGAHVTVTGLAAGASSTVTVTVSVDGSLDATADVTGQALAAVPATTPTDTPLVAPTDSPSDAPIGSPADGLAFNPLTTLPEDVTSPSDPGVDALGDVAPPIVAPSSDPANFNGGKELAPSETTVLIGGHKVVAKLDRSGMRAIVTAGGLTMELALMVDGHEVAFPAGSILTVEQGAHLAVVLRGFKSATQASVWGYSTPVLLDRFKVAADQSGTAEFTLPESMKPGDHTLVAAGIVPSGKTATMAIGIRIIPVAATAPGTLGKPVSSDGFNWWWLTLLLVPAGLAGFWFLIWRRRDDEDEDIQQVEGSPAPTADSKTFPSSGDVPTQRKPAVEPDPTRAKDGK
jgi:predicted RNA-binding protein with TRAM domain